MMGDSAANPSILTIGFARTADDGSLVADCYRFVPAKAHMQVQTAYHWCGGAYV